MGLGERNEYLLLDVWKPAGDASSSQVMVFIHSDGFLVGSKDASVQDGVTFARDRIALFH